jgi:hypothetical protein
MVELIQDLLPVKERQAKVIMVVFLILLLLIQQAAAAAQVQ